MQNFNIIFNLLETLSLGKTDVSLLTGKPKLSPVPAMSAK